MAFYENYRTETIWDSCNHKDIHAGVCKDCGKLIHEPKDDFIIKIRMANDTRKWEEIDVACAKMSATFSEVLKVVEGYFHPSANLFIDEVRVNRFGSSQGDYFRASRFSY
jgi:hypothetical protein